MTFDPAAFGSDAIYLFAMTHPDDEISICCLIRHLAVSGARVHLSWTHDTAVRRTEAEAFADRAGVPRTRLHFHGGTDGRICDEMPTLLPRFHRMIAGVAPDVAVCGAFEQGHLDHDATHVMLRKSFAGPVFEVPFYHTYLTRLQRIGVLAGEGGPVQTRALDEGERKFKREVARGYPSQGIYRLALLHEARELLLGRPPRLLARETLRLATHSDFRLPNHSPRPAARIMRSPRWRRWLAALERLDAAGTL